MTIYEESAVHDLGHIPGHCSNEYSCSLPTHIFLIERSCLQWFQYTRQLGLHITYLTWNFSGQRMTSIALLLDISNHGALLLWLDHKQDWLLLLSIICFKYVRFLPVYIIIYMRCVILITFMRCALMHLYTYPAGWDHWIIIWCLCSILSDA